MIIKLITACGCEKLMEWEKETYSIEVALMLPFRKDFMRNDFNAISPNCRQRRFIRYPSRDTKEYIVYMEDYK